MHVKRILFFALVVLGLASTGLLFLRGRGATTASASPSAPIPDRIAGPGRVEPLSEEIQVSAQIGGKLLSVDVEEGDRICLDEVLAVVENRDLKARVASAEATLAQKEAELRRVVNGARPEERREAHASMKAAEAELENSRIEMERRERAYREGVFAREVADRSVRDHGVAQARFDAARERSALIEAEPREEDRSKAEAEVALARAGLDEARVALEKSFVRSPVAGVVLARHRKAGESVSTMFDTPILTVADDSVLRARVDVDEIDVARIRVGQRAYVTADGYPGQKFWGEVVRVGRLLGRKNLRTDEPTERVDTKILETLIELESARELPLGLRVDAYILLE